MTLMIVIFFVIIVLWILLSQYFESIGEKVLEITKKIFGGM